MHLLESAHRVANVLQYRMREDGVECVRRERQREQICDCQVDGCEVPLCSKRPCLFDLAALEVAPHHSARGNDLREANRDRARPTTAIEQVHPRLEVGTHERSITAGVAGLKVRDDLRAITLWVACGRGRLALRCGHHIFIDLHNKSREMPPNIHGERRAKRVRSTVMLDGTSPW